MTEKKKKVNKSVSLNPDVYDRLLVVCETLGVNVNAYLVNAVGQQIQRDESIKNTQSAMVDSLSSTFEKIMKDSFAEELTEEIATEAIEEVKKENLIIPKKRKP